MQSIKDFNTILSFDKTRDDAYNSAMKVYKEDVAQQIHFHKQFLKLSREECYKIFAGRDGVVEKIDVVKKVLQKNNALKQELQRNTTNIISELEQKQMKKKMIIQKIEKLNEQAKNKELMKSQYKENQDRLKNLDFIRLFFQDQLQLELRTIIDGKFQFVFRELGPDNNSPFVLTMEIRNRSYQIVSCEPSIESLPDLERRLQETNNLAVFLSNVRSLFVSRARGI
ncbi:kinetochore protein Spc25 [Stigmatopora nigra]